MTVGLRGDIPVRQNRLDNYWSHLIYNFFVTFSHRITCKKKLYFHCHNYWSFVIKPACWARRGIIVPFVRRRRLRRRRTRPFGYYTNMVQQIEFIIYTNIQPLLTFFPQGQCQRSRSKIQKILVNAINWKIMIFMLPMSMKMAWLDIQLSTDNQNGRYLATKLFFFRLNFCFQNFLETWYACI